MNAHCHKQLPLCHARIEFMHMAALTNQCAGEMAVMLTWIDDVHCNSFRQSSDKSEQRVNLWSDVFELVVSGEALDKVIMCNCNYADARDAVEDVVVSCNLGVGLYSFAIAATLEQKATNSIQASLTCLIDRSELVRREKVGQLKHAM